ncbi:MAG: hypothetical protein IJA20_05600 [Methanocorpusculum sp.]|nr:hypothetical protein [Methanocorpusculum sp.]
MDNTVPDPAALSAALELFNAGKYDEVISFSSGTADPALMLLSARSYAACGKYDIAESLLRSLVRIMPGSSYVHSYLGDVLLACGKEEAEAEYARAISLDAENIPAVRQYADLVISRGDLRGAIPALRTLVRHSGAEEDVRKLMRTLTNVGEAEEAVSIHRRNFGEDTCSVEYIEALMAVGEYQKALNLALRGWTETKDTAYLRLDLESLSAIDKDAAEKAYRSALDSFEEADIADDNVSAIRFSFVLLEKYRENYDAAEFELSQLLGPDADAVYYLLSAEIAAKKEDGERASAIYRSLIESLMAKDTDWETAELVIDRYTAFLSAVRSKEEVAGVISVVLSVYPQAVCLAKIGEAYENAGASLQAKDWFYRAYRADYLRGGLAYAGYLKRSGAGREADTVIRYIVTNAASVSDLEYAADVILNGDSALYQLEKSRGLVQKSLAGVSERLTSKGREMLAAVYLYSAVDALECGNYEDCKWFCLSGIDVLPCYPETISIQDFSDILARVKGRAISERPILMEKAAEASGETEEIPQSGEEEILPNLDEREKKLLAFLREHREATEMDLRSVLDTRRVAGIVNGLLAKTAEFGVTLIEKRGVGERGEVYGYVGRR